MIDAHTHCFPDALAPRALSKTDLYGGVYETDATISGQIRLAEKEGLRKVVVLHVANRPDSMHHVNDFAVSVNGMAGKVISFASIPPTRRTPRRRSSAFTASAFAASSSSRSGRAFLWTSPAVSRSSARSASLA